jgi:hypothetical protein
VVARCLAFGRRRGGPCDPGRRSFVLTARRCSAPTFRHETVKITPA